MKGQALVDFVIINNLQLINDWNLFQARNNYSYKSIMKAQIYESRHMRLD